MQKTMQKITEPLADAGIFHLLLYLPNFATVHRKWLTSQNCSHKFGTLRLWCRNYHKISLVSCKQTALKKNGVPDPISNKTLIQYMELEASCLYIYIKYIYINIYHIYIIYIYYNISIYKYISYIFNTYKSLFKKLTWNVPFRTVSQSLRPCDGTSGFSENFTLIRA